MKNDLIPLIDGMKLDLGIAILDAQKTWKFWDKKAKSNIVLNLKDAQIEVITPHKITEVVWDVLKLMYEHSRTKQQLMS
jgi:hypothetical protein